MQPFQSIQSSLAPIADAPAPAGPAGATGTSGTFTFVPDEVRVIIQDWIDLAAEYDESIENADQIVRVQPPGDEYASEYHARRTSESGRLYVESLIQKQDYCYSQAQKFQDALHDYLGVDRESVHDIARSGERVSTPSKPGGI